MAESSYMIAPNETADSLALRRKLVLALAEQNQKPPQIDHWAQGLAHLGDAAYSGHELGKLQREEKEEAAKGNAMMASLFNQTGGAQPSASPSVLPQPATSSPAAAPMGALSDMPRGLRNNNPLNIEAGSFTQGQPGFQGSDGRFAKFASLDQGVDAADKLLQTYATKHGLDTPLGIINRWAPPSDNNPTNAYAAKVAAALGTAPDAKLDMANPDTRQKIIAAMAQFENGKPLPQTQMAQAQPQQQGGISRDAIVQMLGNRKTAPMAQKIISDQIGQQFKPETTDEIKEYNLHARQVRASGREPESFTDWKIGIKKAGAIQNTVQIDQKGESEFSKESGKLQAKRFNDLAEDAPAAKQMLSDVEMLRTLGAQIGTGKEAEVKAALGPYAQALGIDVKNLSEIQAFEGIVNRVAPNLRVKGSGAQSDFELKNFLKSLPSIGNTPGGNEIGQKVLEGLYQNKLAAAEIGAKALNGEITRPVAEKMLRDLPDPMKEWREFTKKKTSASPNDALKKKYGLD